MIYLLILLAAELAELRLTRLEALAVVAVKALLQAAYRAVATLLQLHSRSTFNAIQVANGQHKNSPKRVYGYVLSKE